MRTNVGLSEFAIDLVLGDPDEPRVAVLLDGRAWAERLTVRDRDALPREVLTDVLRWPAVERVWLPTWLADPDAVVERLVAAAARPSRPGARGRRVPPPAAGVHGRGTSAIERWRSRRGSSRRRWSRSSPRPRAVAPPTVDVAWPTAAEVFVPWAVRHLGSVDVLDALPARSAASAVSAATRRGRGRGGADPHRQVGPARGERLRAQPRRRVPKAAILRHLPRSLRQDSVESVVWPAARVPEEWAGFRSTPEGLDRPLEHVPLREIVNAMVATTNAAAGMSREELHREVLAVFGLKRRTRGVTERLDVALELGVRTGRFRFDGTMVTPC